MQYSIIRIVMKFSIKHILVTVVCAAAFFALCRYITGTGFQPIKSIIVLAAQQVPQHYTLASVCFLSLMVIVLVIGIPLVPLFGVAGAYLFGPLVGFAYTVFGCIAASIISYFMFKFLFARYMNDDLRKKYGKYEEQIKKHGASYLLMLQFLGVVPLSFINALAVFSHISLFTVVWTTLLGSIPLALVYTIAGGQLRTMESLGDIVSWRMMGLLVLCAVVAMMPVCIRFCINYLNKKKDIR